MVGAADDGDVARLAGSKGGDGGARGGAEEGLVAFAGVVAAVGREGGGVGVVDVAVGEGVVLGLKGVGRTSPCERRRWPRGQGGWL